MESSNIIFSLPFSGTWLTFWGGDTPDLNHHHNTLSQKYAFDFIVTDDQGGFFKIDGKTNEDYFSYGLNILAPAAGTIVEVVSGLRDNKPGQLNNFNFLGNYIMIKHDNKTFSVLGHLKQGSAIVAVGQQVKQGEKIAECGNSGYSTDPHLHFHVQDSEVFAEIDKEYKRTDVATGKKVFFSDSMVNASREKSHSPIKGEKVANVIAT